MSLTRVLLISKDGQFKFCSIHTTPNSIHPSSQLQRVQNSAARLVTNTKRREYTTPVLIELHWLLVRQRIEYKLLLLTFNSLHDLAAPDVAELLSRHQSTRSLRSTDAHLLVVPRSNLCTQGDRSHAAPRLWNNLPLAMRETDSQNIFKKQPHYNNLFSFSL